MRTTYDTAQHRAIADELLTLFDVMATEEAGTYPEHSRGTLSLVASRWLMHAEWAGEYHARKGSSGPTADAMHYMVSIGGIDEGAGDEGTDFHARLGRITYTEDTHGFYAAMVHTCTEQARQAFSTLVTLLEPNCSGCKTRVSMSDIIGATCVSCTNLLTERSDA